MKPSPWQWIKAFPGVLTPPRPEPVRQAELIVTVQRRIVLPVRVGALAIVLYFAFSSVWLNGPEVVLFQTLRGFFIFYIFCIAVAAAIFFAWKHFPPGLFQWLVFILGLLDGLFVAGLLLITGPTSVAFWLFPILIVLNAISIPLAMPQIVLNLLLSVFYIGAGIVHADVGDQINLMYVPRLSPPHAPIETNAVAGARSGDRPAIPEPSRALAQTNAVAGHMHSPAVHRTPIRWDSSMPPAPDEETPAQSFVLSLFVMLLLTLCCYGVQALAERQRRELEEAREFAVREGQLHSAGRLAAEFAHQIKNPLAVIANAAFSLQRSLRENKNSSAQQIEIIQEEVARADRVVTQIMGYAQLSEGRVEKLDVLEELKKAVIQVFPPAVPTDIKIHSKYGSYFPPLLMQRGHLSEIFINLLKNAREALGRTGNISITATCLGDYSVEISIRDDGPGVPPDKIERIFEAYYTTKSGGSGMGLAIVRHNVELYDGRIRLKSEVGKGAEFILTFPAKAIVNMRK